MSLPMDWVRHVGVKAGSELNVEERGLQLIIGPSAGKRSGRKTHIDLRPYGPGLANVVLYNLYVRGDEELVFSYDDPRTEKVLTERVRDLVGFEIVEQCSKRLTVKAIASGQADDFDIILRRVFLLIVSMAEDGIDALRRHDTEELTALKLRDRSVNTLVEYCQRAINTSAKGDMQQAMHLYALLILLEHLGDQYSRFYANVQGATPTVLAIAKETAGLIRDFYTLYYRFNPEHARALQEKRDRIRAAIEVNITRAAGRDSIVALHHLRSIADLVVDIEKFNLAMQLT